MKKYIKHSKKSNRAKNPAKMSRYFRVWRDKPFNFLDNRPIGQLSWV